jgi:glycosyltransferase involved in cell wall biosynthesis
VRRPLLFYSAWPLGFHNIEAERKATALAEAGYDVCYVAGIGIRNPNPANLPKLIDRLRRLGKRQALAATQPATESHEGSRGVREGAIIVAPPRHLEPMRRLNVVWLERQLRRQLQPWKQALAWIRWPTPELIDALAGLRPAHVVYEAVDAYDATPGIVGRWARLFAQYERLLVARADLVVVPGDALAARYRTWGADVRIVPHGVDLGPWRHKAGEHHGRVVVGFIGTLDYRLSITVLRAIALAHPEWRLRLIGPVKEGFDAGAFAGLRNVSLEPTIPAARVPATIASLDVGLMPYIEHPVTTHMTPVKTLEFLAAGVPAVARRLPALERYADHLYFADSPIEFVAGVERALADQTVERAYARRQVAEGHAWSTRLAEIVAIADELTADPLDRHLSAHPPPGYMR